MTSIPRVGAKILREETDASCTLRNVETGKDQRIPFEDQEYLRLGRSLPSSTRGARADKKGAAFEKEHCADRFPRALLKGRAPPVDPMHVEEGRAWYIRARSVYDDHRTAASTAKRGSLSAPSTDRPARSNGRGGPAEDEGTRRRGESGPQLTKRQPFSVADPIGTMVSIVSGFSPG